MFASLAPVGKHFIPYTPDISIALIACLLVMLGNDINYLVRKLVGKQHFIVRTLIFIIINAFGYGLLIVKISPYLSFWLKSMEAGTMLVVIISSFIVIGVWAQKKRHV